MGFGFMNGYFQKIRSLPCLSKILKIHAVTQFTAFFNNFSCIFIF